MKIKPMFMLVGLFIMACPSKAEDFIVVNGNDGQVSLRENLENIDSISLGRTAESYGNYAVDYDGRTYPGITQTARGGIESYLGISSLGREIKILNADPYFASYGYLSEIGYNTIVCDYSIVRGDTLYMYAQPGQLLGYDDAYFDTYSQDYENGKIAFAIADSGFTFIYLSGLVINSQDGIWNYIEPNTAIANSPSSTASFTAQLPGTSASLDIEPVKRAPKAISSSISSSKGKIEVVSAGGSSAVRKNGLKLQESLQDAPVMMKKEDLLANPIENK